MINTLIGEVTSLYALLKVTHNARHQMVQLQQL
jgi:hypothetical protein